MSSATRPFSALATLMALQLQAARQQQPVDLVVVGNQQAGAALSHGADPSSAAAATCVLRLRAHRCRWRRPGSAALSSSSRACAPSAVAPKVWALVFSECAARRKRSACARRRSALRSSANIGGASSKNVSTSSTTKSRAPAAGEGVVMWPCSSREALTRRSRRVSSLVSASLTAPGVARGVCVRASTSCIDADRLGHVVVHAGGQAHLAVALHRVGGHGDDARPLAAAELRA